MYYGSLVAAPYVGEIFANIFDHFNIPKDERLMSEDYYKYFEMPDLIGMSYPEASRVLKGLELSFESDGEGVVVKQIPEAGSKVNKYNVGYIKLE